MSLSLLLTVVPSNLCPLSRLQVKKKVHNFFGSSPTHSFAPRPTPQAIQWEKPPPGWICVNTDGAISSTTHFSFAGGVLRDSEGVWILGFQQGLGFYSPLDSELWGIYTSLHLAWNLGFREVLVQSDCLEVIKLVEDPHSTESSSSLVRAIAHLRQRHWETTSRWFPREANIITEFTLLESVPLSLERSLLRDIVDNSKNHI
ncbi:hypothetical protein F3Y22_tig00003721pilonHSYRG00093 [Hibiscus syriacus]|uniref:RNase H type-1 domain-containing protein n=1 Tax=Hibiscus syriacus TaxID=106335 RepID=A0A6A3CIY5_HIBSY|nr:hypothetical protein F3Y22_tig00003721pilonHSYRG00093 [Hibiscus syriacus]